MEVSKSLPKIPKKNVAKELLSSYDEKDALEREYILSLIKDTAVLHNNPETGYRLDELKHVNNPALEKDFKHSIESFRAMQKLHTLKQKVDKEYFYMADSEEEMLKIVRHGFRCEHSVSDDKNLLGGSRYGFHLLKHLDVGLKYYYSKKINPVYVILVKTFYSSNLVTCVNESNPTAFKSDDFYPDYFKGILVSTDLMQNDSLPIQTNYCRSLVYYSYSENMNDPEVQMKNLLPTSVLKFTQTKPDVFDPSIFCRVKPKINTKAKKTPSAVSMPLSIPASEVPTRRVIVGTESISLAPLSLSKQTTPGKSIIQMPRIVDRPPLPTKKVSEPPPKPSLAKQAVPAKRPESQIDPSDLVNRSILSTVASPTLVKEAAPVKRPESNKKLVDESQFDPSDLVTPESLPRHVASPQNTDQPESTQPLPKSSPNKTQPVPSQIKTEPVDNSTIIDDNNDESFTSSSSESEFELPSFDVVYNDYRRDYAAVIEQLYSKPSKWRLMFEKTGRLDFKFRGVKKLQVVLGPDIKTKNLVYSNPEKTIINTKHSTNALILAYSSLKKKVPTVVVAKLPASSSSDAVGRSAIVTTNLQKKPSSTSTSTPSNSQSSSGGSDMTSLEKKLMSKPAFAKIKEDAVKPTQTAVKQTPTTAPSAEATKSAPSSNPPPSNARLKMLLEQNKREKQQAEQRLNAIKARQSQINKELSSSSTTTTATVVEPRRKKSFWEPDSDSEFGIEKKLKGKGEDLDEDIIILSRPNMPTFECSKQFYDSNMEMFETQLRYFVSSITPSTTSLIKGNCTVTAKTPISSATRSTTNTTSTSSSRRSAQNEPKYVHYVTVSHISTPINKSDVDVLAKKSKHAASTANTELEIYSAGFRCIKDHVFQRTNRYMRRVKSFQLLNPSTLGDALSPAERPVESSSQPELSSSAAAYKKISLNDYSSRASLSRPPVTLSQPVPTVAATAVASNEDSTNLLLTSNNNSLDPEASSNNSQDNRSFNTSTNQLRICDLTNLTNTQLPTPPTLYNSLNKSHHSNLPTLSLMDEVKKRINQSKLDEKSLSSSRDNEASEREEENKKQRARHQKRVKKRKLKSKRVKKSKHDKKKKSKKSRVSGKRIKSGVESGEAESGEENDDEREEDSDASGSSTNYSISTLSCSSSSLSISDMSVSSSSLDEDNEDSSTKLGGGYSVSSTSVSSVDVETKKRKKKADKKKRSKRSSHRHQHHHSETTTQEKEDRDEIKEANDKSSVVKQEPEEVVKNEPLEEEEEGEINDSDDVEDADKSTSTKTTQQQKPSSLVITSQSPVRQQLKRSHNDSYSGSEWPPAKSRTKPVEMKQEPIEKLDSRSATVVVDDRPAGRNNLPQNSLSDSNTIAPSRLDPTASTNQNKRDYSSSTNKTTTSRHSRAFSSFNTTNNIISSNNNNNMNKFNSKLNKSFGHDTNKPAPGLLQHQPSLPLPSYNKPFNNQFNSSVSHSKFAITSSMNQPVMAGPLSGGLVTIPASASATSITPAPLLNPLPGLYPSYPKPLLDNFMPTNTTLVGSSPNSFPIRHRDPSQPHNHSDTHHLHHNSFSTPSRGFNFTQSQSRLHAQRYNNSSNMSGGKRPTSAGAGTNNNGGKTYNDQFRFAPSSFKNNREDNDEGEIV